MSVQTLPRPAPGTRNGLPWKPYVYRGTGEDALTAFIDDWPDEDVAVPVPAAEAHGTVAGYRRHRRRGEKPCEPCRLAENARSAEYSAHRRKPKAQAVHAPARESAPYPRCGRPRARRIAGPGEEVTCGLCLIIAGSAA